MLFKYAQMRGVKKMNSIHFKNKQYCRVAELMKSSHIFNGDTGGGIFKGKAYPFILKNCQNNLYTPVKDDVLDYFKDNHIAWWNGRLTNHTLSSQIACLNHFFPIRDNKEAVLAVIKRILPDIVDIMKIPTDKYMPAYIQFEAVSDTDHLNELTSTRGSNCTSVDALIYGVHKDGRKILFPIEWKYVELYNSDNKARGDKGVTRKKRYTELINTSAQLRSENHDIYYFEPFYQLMRQTLWAEQMVAHRKTETIQADDYLHIHVIPPENNELLHKLYTCSGKGMEETWRGMIKDQGKYMIVSPESLLSPIEPVQFRSLQDYLKIRYW